MKMTGLNQYQQEVLRTAPRDPRAYPIPLRDAVAALREKGHGGEIQADELLKIWDQMVWGLGLAGEAGEVADLLKKKHGHGKDVPNTDVKKELGDVGWYGNALADSFGYTAEDVATGNSEKLRARHPVGFTVETANAPVRGDEVRMVMHPDGTVGRVRVATGPIGWDGNGSETP